MSVVLRLSVLPSVMSSVRLLGTRVDVSVDFGLHQGLTADFIGIAVGVDNTLVDAPRDLKGDVLVAGKQVEYLVLLAKGE